MLCQLRLGTIRPCWICGCPDPGRLDADPYPAGLVVLACLDLGPGRLDLDLDRRLAGLGRVGPAGRPVDRAGDRPVGLVGRDDWFRFTSKTSGSCRWGAPDKKHRLLGIGSE